MLYNCFVTKFIIWEQSILKFFKITSNPISKSIKSAQRAVLNHVVFSWGSKFSFQWELEDALLRVLGNCQSLYFKVKTLSCRKRSYCLEIELKLVDGEGFIGLCSNGVKLAVAKLRMRSHRSKLQTTRSQLLSYYNQRNIMSSSQIPRCMKIDIAEFSCTVVQKTALGSRLLASQTCRARS